MRKVFAKKYMVILQREEHDEYIVYNTKKDWDNGHTHIHTYKQAQYLVDCVLKNKIPKKANRYFLVSLLRITESKKQRDMIQRILNGEIEPHQHYKNSPKTYRK